MNIYELAELMHGKLCRWNHIDQCAWDYREKLEEKWTESWEHRTWLDRAYGIVIMTGMSIEDIAKVIENL